MAGAQHAPRWWRWRWWWRCSFAGTVIDYFLVFGMVVRTFNILSAIILFVRVISLLPILRLMKDDASWHRSVVRLAIEVRLFSSGAAYASLICCSLCCRLGAAEASAKYLLESTMDLNGCGGDSRNGDDSTFAGFLFSEEFRPRIRASTLLQPSARFLFFRLLTAIVTAATLLSRDGRLRLPVMISSVPRSQEFNEPSSLSLSQKLCHESSLSYWSNLESSSTVGRSVDRGRSSSLDHFVFGCLHLNRLLIINLLFLISVCLLNLTLSPSSINCCVFSRALSDSPAFRSTTFDVSTEIGSPPPPYVDATKFIAFCEPLSLQDFGLLNDSFTSDDDDSTVPLIRSDFMRKREKHRHKRRNDETN